MLRSNFFWSVIACVFMEILISRKAKENAQIDTISKNVVLAKPMQVSAIASSTNEKVKGIRLSYRDTSHPDTGRPTNELMGINKRRVPSSASLYPKFVLIVGIREA